MKVERKEAEFQPVVITLETQDEVNALWDLLGQLEPSNFKTAEDKLEGLYLLLDPYKQDGCEYEYYKL